MSQLFYSLLCLATCMMILRLAQGSPRTAEGIPEWDRSTFQISQALLTLLEQRIEAMNTTRRAGHLSITLIMQEACRCPA